MGGSSGGTTVYQPAAAAAPTASQSAAEYAAALPTILSAQLKFQPQFDQAQYDSAATLGPKYAALLDQINKQTNPQTAALQETLAGQAMQGATATQIPDYMRKQYQDTVNAQLGTNANAPIGADYVSRGLINQAEGYRQYYQNLGLSLAGRQPLAGSAGVPQSNFDVAGQTSANYGNVIAGYNAYNNATRPISMQSGTPNWVSGLSAGGSVLQGIGSIGKSFCWVASECFGGWYAPKTVWARFYVANFAPKWFLKSYIKYGERISKNKILVALLRPLFELFAKKGKAIAYGK